MANRFYTILIIPEKTSQVRRFIIRGWIPRALLIGSFFAFILTTLMVLDYWYVMSAIGENKSLKIENRRLRQQVQIFKNKMDTIEGTMERVQNFATRLRVITNIDDKDGLVKSLNRHLPDASKNIAFDPTQYNQGMDQIETDLPEETASKANPKSAHVVDSSSVMSAGSEALFFIQEQETLDQQFTLLSSNTLLVEQNLQDLYELLADQKAFLSALPTKRPALGYFTSGFGVRKSPYGGIIKMHEGLDIANHIDTPVRATANGIISFAGMKPGYGKTVIIDHGYGLETWYGHNRQVLVKDGQKVRRGDSISLMGSTGRSTGPHLHYEVRVHGIPVDPLSYILEN